MVSLVVFILLSSFIRTDLKFEAGINIIDTGRINDSNLNQSNQDKIIPEIPLKLDAREGEEGFYPYDPILSTQGQSNTLEVEDKLQYSDSETFNLTNKRTGSESTDYIGGAYDVANLTYEEISYETEITNIVAVKDFYSYESYTSGLVGILRDSPANNYLAQGFEIEWEKAKFSAVRAYIEGAGTTDSIRLLLFPSKTEAGRIKPDTNALLSSTVWYDPDELPLPVMNGTTMVELPTFNFNTEVTLSKGIYFIVIQFSDNDGFFQRYDLFLWYGNDYDEDPLKTPLSYQSTEEGPWEDVLFNFTLEVELLPVDNGGFALTIDNPKSINLRDNGVQINETSFSIEGDFVGEHILTSNTSIDIYCTRHYNFLITYETDAVYLITNSTFNEHTCYWNISWNTDSISSFYALTSRNLSIATPMDWNDSFNWYYNDAIVYPSERTQQGYITYLGTNTSSGSWKIETTSPNHVFSTVLSDEFGESERYLLGYWTTNETHVFGYNGSNIYVSVLIKSNYTELMNISSGSLNFTLYDRNGEYVLRKTNTNTSFIFEDKTDYCVSDVQSVISGVFETNLTFDPSINGSDLPGFWTAVIQWQNGSEVGFLTQRIVVQSQTLFSVNFEEIPGEGEWVEKLEISREIGDEITFLSYFYNISEPYFNLTETFVSGANVSLTKSWNDQVTKLNETENNYHVSFIVDTTLGFNGLELLATGPFLEEHYVNINMTVFFESKILNVGVTENTIQYSSDSVYEFKFVNASDPINSTVPIEQLHIFANGTKLSENQFEYETNGGVTTLTIIGEESLLEPGSYIIEVQAFNEKFRYDYRIENAFINYNLYVVLASYNVELSIVGEEVQQLEEFSFEVQITGTTQVLQTRGETPKQYIDPQGQITIYYEFTLHNGTVIQEEITIQVDNNQTESFTFITNPIEAPWRLKQLTATAVFVPEQDLANVIASSESEILSVPKISLPRFDKMVIYLFTNYTVISIVVSSISIILLLVLSMYILLLRPRKKRKVRKMKQEFFLKTKTILDDVSSIKKIIVVNNESSLPTFELDLDQEIKIDTSLITGFFQAISTVGSELTESKSQKTQKFDYGNFLVLSIPGENYSSYLLCSKGVSEQIENGLSEFTKWFDRIFVFKAKNWSGHINDFSTYDKQIIDRITEELYIWTLKPLRINPMIELKNAKLRKHEKEIINCINTTNKCTVTDIIEKMEKYSQEDKLIALFNLREREIIISEQTGPSFAEG